MGAFGAGDERPQHVGILAADVYFPSTFVAQVRARWGKPTSQSGRRMPSGQEVLRCPAGGVVVAEKHCWKQGPW